MVRSLWLFIAFATALGLCRSLTAQESLSRIDQAAISQFNRESEFFLFKQETAGSLYEVASRDYSPIEFPSGPSGKQIDGFVVDLHGVPVANASVLLLKNGIPGCEAEVQFGTRDILFKQVTSSDGRFAFELPILARSDSVILRLLAVHPISGIGVETVFSEEFFPFPDFPKGRDVRMQLRPARPISGVVACEGKPVSDAEVCVTQIDSSQGGFLMSHERLYSVGYGTRASSDVLVRTNEKGEFRIDAIPTRGKFLLRVRHARFPTKYQPIVFLDPKDATSEEVEFTDEVVPMGVPARTIRSLADPVTINLDPGDVVRGRVLVNGELCPHAYVVTSTGEFSTVDPDGRFAIPVPSQLSSEYVAVSAYVNCHPFDPGVSLIATESCKPDPSREYQLNLKPAVLITGRVSFRSETARRQSWVAFKQQDDLKTFPLYFRFDDQYWAIAAAGQSTIMLTRNSQSGSDVLMSITKEVSGALFRFPDLKDQPAIRLVIEAVDGSGQPVPDGKLSAMKFLNLGTDRLSMNPLPLEEGPNHSWIVTLSEEETTVVLHCTRPGNDDAPFGSSGYEMIVTDPSFRRRESPLQLQLNRNVSARVIVSSSQATKPIVKVAVSESIPPSPAWEANSYETDSEGLAEFGVNPFSVPAVQVVSIDGRPVNMFPIQASPDNRYLFRIGLGDAFISGKVVLANDKPALNRMVYLWSTANPTSPFQWTLSEPDGSFRFAWLPEGEYRVEAVSFSYDGLYRMDRNESAQNSQTVKSGQSNLELRLPSE